MFHLFPRFPFDIRKQIWESTAEPRTVDVRAERVYERWGGLLYILSTTPVPAILHTCREARNLGIYQKAFNSHFEGVPSRHVWVNFELDMISIGVTYLEDEIYLAEKHLFRRLALERDNDEFFYRWENTQLQKYPSVKEIDVICADGVQCWWTAWKNLHWPCPKENIRFIDKETGWAAKGEELQGIEEEYADALDDDTIDS